MNLSEHNNLFALFFKSIAITIIVFLCLLVCCLIIKYLNICPFLYDSFGYGTFGDFIGGFIGTIATIATLIVVYKSFRQVNEQSTQQTIAILLQSYQHTIEDYDYYEKPSNSSRRNNGAIVYTGREGIKKIVEKKLKPLIKNLNNPEEYIDKREKIIEKHKELAAALTNDFPTHIPAIIVSILYTIESINDKEQKNLYKQVKAMLSYEERKLLLYYLLEQFFKNDTDFKVDRLKIITLLAFEKEKDKESASGISTVIEMPLYFDKYDKNLFDFIINAEHDKND
jgi:hypothetical protein